MIPWQERNSRLRGPVDLITGRYPAFLFGAGLGSWLPVFHFHEAHPAALEPYFRFLVENGYRTVDSDAITAYVRRGLHPGKNTVALCFDDAWSSLWLAVDPLLKQYGLRAITYVSPARVPSAPVPRTPGGSPLTPDQVAMDRNDPMFCTWSELRALQSGGRVDIQAHSWRHAMIFADDRIHGFIGPGHHAHPHEIPLLDAPDGLRFAEREDLGAPLYTTRSRLSDARRWIAPGALSACLKRVASAGGAAFFDRPAWRQDLLAEARKAGPGRWESDAGREAAITQELAQGREILESELGKPVHHMCFPWAIAGSTAIRMAERTGYQTAFADRLGGARALRAGDPPYQLMRLKHPLIFCLPGKGRTTFLGPRPPAASSGLDLGPVALPAHATSVGTPSPGG